MPPKKQATEDKARLGRPGNNLKIGVVGLPNVGKSTFFNAITSSAVAAENYPFCTIDPEESRVAVPDERFDWLCEHYKPSSKVPAYLTIIDIAGLVKGASEGAGLGNAFLSHVRAVDGIFHVVRAFNDPDVVHVEGEVDPGRDLDIIHSELRMKDIAFLSKTIDEQAKNIARLGNGGNADDKKKKEEFGTLEKVLEFLKSGKDVRKGDWTNKEIYVINQQMLLTAKPVIYLANVSEKDYVRRKNKFLPKIKAWIDENNPGDMLIPFSGVFETTLQAMEGADRDAYLAETKGASAFPKIITTGYHSLDLQHFFTAGHGTEVRAWTCRKGAKMTEAARSIHNEIADSLIQVDVMKFDELKAAGSEPDLKAQGKLYIRGKDAVCEDGDVVYFRSGMGRAKK
ncbi:GTP-binding protein YchF [Linderina pennispora]|uniref:GTP-binding protein YchF n=1 Tax=Linderina pennispora TaxID=61395 RepID=A0A1Y1W033_9FUNG|nr:GTP-binding protein YchF [Linderina pennispora]ORX66616.1 GTP-binding protein YchF [Linderina pennispora]